MTRNGKGSVRLSSMDFTTSAFKPFTFSGIDLQTPAGTPCATWNVTFVSGRSSTDFTLPAANVAEGASAVTPVPSSTGANNLTGTYVFNVSCKDAGANVSNTVTLTRTIVNPGGGGAVNYGTTDTNVNFMPSGFGTSPGAYILFSTGMDRSNARFVFNISSGFTQTVVLTYADITRPGGLSNMQIASTTNLAVNDLVASGAFASQGALCVFCSSNGPYSNTTFNRDFGYFSVSYIGNASTGYYNAGGCTSGCGLFDSGVDTIDTGITSGGNPTISNVWVWHFYDNCHFLGDSTAGIAFQDVMCIAPMTRSAIHTDNSQIADGATPPNITYKRFMQLQADGFDQAQGAMFFGNLLVGMGYVDDGTASHGPGTQLTLTSTGNLGVFSSSSNGSQIFSPFGSPVGVSDNVRVTCIGSCSGNNKANLNISATNIGSPGSPVAFYSVKVTNMQLDGMIYAGATFNGYSQTGAFGTSFFKDFDYVQQNANPAAITTYQGSITGSVLTVSTQPTSNIPSILIPLVAFAGRLNYPGCAYCGVGIAQQLTGPSQGIGTYQLSSAPGNLTTQTIQNSTAYPITGAGAIGFGSCGTPVYGAGAMTVSSGYGQSGIGSCSDIAFSHTFSTTGGGGATGSASASDFASGMLPQTYLQAIPGATWQAMTIPQMQAKVCLSLKKKIGGAFDGGGGVWYGSLTGETDAVLHTGGGNWIQNGVDSGIHIAGCEAAP